MSQVNLFPISNEIVCENKLPGTTSLKVKDLSVVDKNNIEVTERLIFLLAGKAKFTVHNVNTNNRYTFYVRKSKTKNQYVDYYFVSVLTGNNNETNYTYLGMLSNTQSKLKFYLTKNSKHKETATTVRTFNWIIKNINTFPDNVKFYHAGCCARCGKLLTKPISIEKGFGEKCFLIKNKNVA